MGVFGIHLGECDGSLDLPGNAGDRRDWSKVESRIAGYVGGGGCEDADGAAAALELVAAAPGNPSPRLRVELSDWTKHHASRASDMRVQALVAVDRVSGSSELSALWAKGAKGPDWQATIADVRTRLQA